MSKKDKQEINLVRSVNKNIRSSTRKLNPILKGIVGKKVDLAIRDLDFQIKEYVRISKKLYLQLLQMQKTIFNMILINFLLKKLIVVNKLL